MIPRQTGKNRKTPGSPALWPLSGCLFSVCTWGATVQVGFAEVDGNRTRRAGVARPTRFEGGGAHQVLGHLHKKD